MSYNSKYSHHKHHHHCNNYNHHNHNHNHIEYIHNNLNNQLNISNNKSNGISDYSFIINKLQSINIDKLSTSDVDELYLFAKQNNLYSIINFINTRLKKHVMDVTVGNNLHRDGIEKLNIIAQIYNNINDAINELEDYSSKYQIFSNKFTYDMFLSTYYMLMTNIILRMMEFGTNIQLMFMHSPQLLIYGYDFSDTFLNIDDEYPNKPKYATGTISYNYKAFNQIYYNKIISKVPNILYIKFSLNSVSNDPINNILINGKTVYLQISELQLYTTYIDYSKNTIYVPIPKGVFNNQSDSLASVYTGIDNFIVDENITIQIPPLYLSTNDGNVNNEKLYFINYNQINPDIIFDKSDNDQFICLNTLDYNYYSEKTHIVTDQYYLDLNTCNYDLPDYLYAEQLINAINSKYIYDIKYLNYTNTVDGDEFTNIKFPTYLYNTYVTFSFKSNNYLTLHSLPYYLNETQFNNIGITKILGNNNLITNKYELALTALRNNCLFCINQFNKYNQMIKQNSTYTVNLWNDIKSQIIENI